MNILMNIMNKRFINQERFGENGLIFLGIKDTNVCHNHGLNYQAAIDHLFLINNYGKLILMML